MRILFAHDPPDLYGASRSLLRLALRLAKEGHEVLVVVPDEGSLCTQLQQPGVAVKLCRLATVTRRQYGSLSGLCSWLVSFVLSIPEFWRTVTQFRPDIIHTNNSLILTSGVVAKLRGIPHFWHVREIFADFPRLRPWQSEHCDRCQKRGYVAIGNSRIVAAVWEPRGELRFTQCCNLPIQGAAADCTLRALKLIHQALIVARIRGGLVACVHDEFVIEVHEDDAEAARIPMESSIARTEAQRGQAVAAYQASVAQLEAAREGNRELSGRVAYADAGPAADEAGGRAGDFFEKATGQGLVAFSKRGSSGRSEWQAPATGRRPRPTMPWRTRATPWARPGRWGGRRRAGISRRANWR